MEKADQSKSHKPKNKFLKYLPRAATSASVSISFQNRPTTFSPGRDHHHLRNNAHKGFSGPILIPDEARRKTKEEQQNNEEPTSPKVSCIGQIKKKKMLSLKSSTNDKQSNNNNPTSSPPCEIKERKKKKKKCSAIRFSMIRRIFVRSSGKENSVVGANSTSDHRNPRRVISGSTGMKKDEQRSNRVSAPSLGQMRRFASGRDTLGNFDWTAQIAPVDEYYSDEEWRRGRDSDGDEEDDDEIIVPFSAPILMGGGAEGSEHERDFKMFALKDKKEINLWRRRTVDPPSPLKVN